MFPVCVCVTVELAKRYQREVIVLIGLIELVAKLQRSNFIINTLSLYMTHTLIAYKLLILFKVMVIKVY